MHLKSLKYALKTAKICPEKHQNMHLKTPKHLHKKSKILKIRAYFLQKVKLFNKMY